MDITSLVDDLRGLELESLESEIRAGRRSHILKTLDERGRAQELIRQQYTGRYPFELLQNANDAAGDPDAAGRNVRFVLAENALIVADQGGGFGENQIRAICGLGRSSKDPRKSIGYKGLGFKSVGEITSIPQILSGGFGFAFDEERARAEVERIAGDLDEDQRLPIYALPFSINAADLGEDQGLVERLQKDGFQTVLRLPFKDDVDRASVEKHLRSTLTPRLLLFLDATEELSLSGTDGDFKAVSVRQAHGQCEEVLLESSGDAEHWLVYGSRLDIPSVELVQKLGDAWKEVEQVRISVAIPLDKAGRPGAFGPHPLHVYFPTAEYTGFAFILHADFALDIDRRHITLTPESRDYNHWLARQSAQFFGEVAVPDLVNRFPGGSGVVRAVAPVREPAGFGQEVRELCVEALRSSRFVPCVDGQTRLPAEVKFLPESVPDPEAAHRAIDLLALRRLVAHGIDHNTDVRRLLIEVLNAEELSPTDVIRNLCEPAEGEDQKFYEFLVDWSESAGQRALAGAMSHARCVRTQDGQWRTPKGVFFPRQRGEIEIPVDLPVAIASVPDDHVLRSLLEDAGVKPFEWRALLPSYVLPRLTRGGISHQERDAAFRLLREYHRTERSGDPRLQTQIQQVLLPARDTTGALREMKAAGSLYFSASWVGDEDLETIYGPFGIAEFLDIDLPSDDDEIQLERDFYDWLGVSAVPRVDIRHSQDRDQYMVHNEAHHPHRKAHQEPWDKWIRSPAVRMAKDCDQNHSYSQQIRTSAILDRFPELLDADDPNRMSALWRCLTNRWGGKYEAVMSSEFYCQATAHTGHRSRNVPSILGFCLKEMPWVPCKRNGEPVLVTPNEAWRVTQTIPRRVVERVAALPRDLDTPQSLAMAATLGIVDAARPSASDIIRLLTSLAAEHEHATESSYADPEIFKAARWAMRSLNDVLLDGDELEVAEVPLLACLSGRRVFVSRPYIADDAFLAETWESSVPILDADRDLRQLHRQLKLPKLDDEVIVRPVPNTPRPDLLVNLEEKIVSAKPYLAAVASEAVPSRREDVFRGLSRLEVLVCEDLILEYQFNGEARQRDEAVAYIAIRQEQVGSTRRNIGTAHLEIDRQSGQPHWYTFGPLLAQFLGVPSQSDAFALLLQATTQQRREYLSARRISSEAVEQARIELAQPPEDEHLEDLLGGFIGDPDRGAPSGPTGDEEEGDRSDDNEVGDLGTREGYSESEEREQIKFPDLDLKHIDISDAACEAKLTNSGSRPRPGTGTGTGPSVPVDFDAQHRIQRQIGYRGEKAAYHAEQLRLSSLGLDPENVNWISRDKPFAPYDMESIDVDGQKLFIEVKATTASDPTDPFEISEAELICAIRKRSNYYIYRVTETHQERPKITRYRDPISRLNEESARLRLSGARLSFADGAADD